MGNYSINTVFTLPPHGLTLNGVPIADANTMVKNFRTDPTSSDGITAIWLKKAWVDNVVDILTAETGDGIRIYFAKTNDAYKRNTVVIVSTQYNGVNLQAESKQNHLDYYIHNSPFLASPDAAFLQDWSGDSGATLFNSVSPCASDNCAIVASDDNYISCQNAWVAVNEFKKNQLGNPQINTYSEWFPLKMLQNIKAQLAAELATDPQQPADGIRIYFAKHTQSTTATDSHKGRHAYIVVTTQTLKINGVDAPRQDNYRCYSHLTGDNGEQCLNNCNGANLPAS